MYTFLMLNVQIILIYFFNNISLLTYAILLDMPGSVMILFKGFMVNFYFLILWE